MTDFVAVIAVPALAVATGASDIVAATASSVLAVAIEALLAVDIPVWLVPPGAIVAFPD